MCCDAGMSAGKYSFPEPRGEIIEAVEPIPVTITWRITGRIRPAVFEGVVVAWTSEVVRVRFHDGIEEVEGWVAVGDVQRVEAQTQESPPPGEG